MSNELPPYKQRVIVIIVVIALFYVVGVGLYSDVNPLTWSFPVQLVICGTIGYLIKQLFYEQR